jgi:CheY-like chemotaxis protein
VARVLILDDDLAALAVAKRAVRAAGHDAVAVVNAADARAALDGSTPPDVLLASPTADSGEALALAEKVRSDPTRARTQVLLLGDPHPSGLETIARPLDAPSVGARIAGVLARTGGRAPVTTPSAKPSAPRRPGALAESALRALFRRQAQPPPPAPPPGPQVVDAPPRDLLDGKAARRADVPVPAVPFSQLVERARTADYFAVLGLRRSASRGDVADASARLLGDIDARRLTPAGYDSPEIDDVRQVVVDARDVLSDDELRAAYLKGIEDVAESPAE